MSLPRPSGLKAPTGSKLARPSTGIPQKSGLMQPGSLSRAQSAIAKSARAAGLNTSVADKYAHDAANALQGEEELHMPPPPVDDFIIGDRVFVSGSKPGTIAFIGETQFAPGDWAGVVLDETFGKNDGSVNGVRYFQCEPKRGVFCRISKLSRTPGIVGAARKSEDAVSEHSVPVNGDNNGRRTPSLTQRPMTPSRLVRPTTPSLPRPMTKSLSSSSTSLSKGHAPVKTKSDPVTATPMASGIKHNLKVGDRVLVSGSKLGTLRYIGPTDFAKGEWAGVELDDPVGKNDGAVAGKRYFDCRPKYGLFAPCHKVTKTSTVSTPSPMTRSLGSVGLGLRTSRERSGSQESVSSLSSATSSASRPRVRLGVSGLGNSQPSSGRAGQRPSSLNITATTSALQKALKEKEEHIEQLLRERDLERSDVARAAAQVEEAQDQLTQIKVEKERLLEENEESLQQLKARVQKLANEKHELVEKLEDERRKVEDLQFRIEEEVISKDDLESQTEEEQARVRDLEKNLKRERERADKLDIESQTFKAMVKRHEASMKEMEDTQTSYLDQIEELTHKLSQAETQLQEQDSSRLEEGAKTSQVSLELEEKQAKVSELEDFLSLKNKEVKQLQEKLTELKDELESRTSKQEKLQQTVEELTEKLKTNESINNELSEKFQNLKSKTSDLQRQLTDSQQRSNQLLEEKGQLDQQVAEMMKNTGDSSNQLSMLNEQLAQKSRKLEEVQADLSTSTQKWHNLNSEHEAGMREKDREMEALKHQLENIRSSLTGDLQDVQKELEKSKSKIITMEQDFETEKAEVIKRKESEISELKQQLETAAENVNKQEIQTQAHKQLLDNITMERDAIQFEKEKFEKQLRRVEGERDTVQGELITAQVEASRHQSGQEQAGKDKAKMEEKIQDLTEDKGRLEAQLAEVQKQREDSQADKERLSTERDQFQHESMEHRASLQQKDMLVAELQKEVERLRQESGQHQETIGQLTSQMSDSGEMQRQVAEHVTLVEGLKQQLSQRDEEASKLREAADSRDGQLKTVKIELEEAQETVSLLEDSVKDLEKVKESLTSQLQDAFEARHEQDKVLELNRTLNEEIESIKKRHRSDLENQKSSQSNLQSEVDSTKALLSQKQAELQEKQSQIINLEKETSMLGTYKSANEKLEKETSELHDKINKLQSKLTEAQNNTNVSNANTNSESKTVTSEESGESAALISKLKEDSESAQGQVEFLNSVIVDLQHKNEELKVRLEAMETGVHINGQDDSHVETPSRRTAPRAFCDICDVFDQHETEDCPLQEMSDSPPPSQYHGDRNQVRPYCDICEEFHPPCPGLSVKKIEQTGAEPIDPAALVEDWVKTVDTVHSELAEESEKIFGNDGEFFHVQQDPANVPAFRDSGYYENLLDSPSKQPLDLKSAYNENGSILGGSVTLSEQEQDIIISGICKKQSENVKATGAINVGRDITKTDQQVRPNIGQLSGTGSKNRPSVLQPPQTTRCADDVTENMTPASVTSPSDSEYMSGQESLGSSSSDSPDSPSEQGKPDRPEVDPPLDDMVGSDMETSVDTGEVFESDSPAEEAKSKPATDKSVDQAAENCVVS